MSPRPARPEPVEEPGEDRPPPATAPPAGDDDAAEGVGLDELEAEGTEDE